MHLYIVLSDALHSFQREKRAELITQIEGALNEEEEEEEEDLVC